MNVHGLDALCDAVVRLLEQPVDGARHWLSGAQRHRPGRAWRWPWSSRRWSQAAGAGRAFHGQSAQRADAAETAIDATLGLGEALVSGQVEPDHYVVGRRMRRTIVHKTLGAKATVILGRAGGGTVTLQAGERQPAGDPRCGDSGTGRSWGQRCRRCTGFRRTSNGRGMGAKLYLLQARPITSLYPLPAGMPAVAAPGDVRLGRGARRI